MPALVNSKVGSSAGTSEDEATCVWPFETKKSTKAWRICETVAVAVVALEAWRADEGVIEFSEEI